MKNYESQHIRNIAIIGHAGCGKTTLAETMLFEAGVISRMGNVEDGNTVSDYHEIEHERVNSIHNTLMYLDWKDSKINIIDTPGFDDFSGEALTALSVADTAIMLLNAQHGVEVQTDILWEYTKQLNKPVIFTINQVDQDNADIENTIEQLKNNFGRKVTTFQYPLDSGPGFDSIIDVLKMIMYKFPKGGGKPEKLPIPDEEKQKAEQLHTELIENVAEVQDSLMELYFEKGTLEEDEMKNGLQKALIQRDIFPVFCLSAKQNMGSGRLMGFINNIVPSPVDLPPLQLNDEQSLACDAKGDPCLFIYKTSTEQNLGEMLFFKVYSGEIKVGMDLVNENTKSTERFNQLYFINGKERTNTKIITSGDIGATVKLKNSNTNNTLHLKGKKIEIPPVKFPKPTIRTAVVSQKKGEEERLSIALHQIIEEDLSINVEQSQELKQTIIHAQGELQLNILKWRLENIFKLSIDYIKPRIPYRETISKSAKSSYRHKKQSGGAGQFAEVYMLIEPFKEDMPDPEGLNVRGRETVDLKWGGKLVFYNCIVGGAIDVRFLPSILKGVMEKMVDGPMTNSCVRDVRVSIYDGKMHPVDSNDMAFKIAGMRAFKDAFREAGPIILEPIYEVEVMVPDEMGGDVMSDLQTRRAVILGMDSGGQYQIIKAKVPLAELHSYSSTLRSISQGRAKHKEKYIEYAPVPFDIQQKLIEEQQKELEEA
ncbi:MAG: elongation factor G [Bacteroidota bacterium]